MDWTPELKREAAIVAPMLKTYVRPDTRVIERPGWAQVITPSAQGFLNEISLSQVEPQAVERCIDDAIATYREHGRRFTWTVSPWTRPLDMGVHLRRRGFVSTRAVGMGAPTDLDVAPPPDVATREVTDDASLEAFVTCNAAGWSATDHDLTIDLPAHRALLEARPQRVRFWLAEHDGAPIGTAVTVLLDGHGYLVGGQVLEAHRRRGVYRALVAARLAQLRDLDMGYAVTLARLDTAAPALARMGFEAIYDAEVFSFDPRA